MLDCYNNIQHTFICILQIARNWNYSRRWNWVVEKCCISQIEGCCHTVEQHNSEFHFVRTDFSIFRKHKRKLKRDERGLYKIFRKMNSQKDTKKVFWIKLKVVFWRQFFDDQETQFWINSSNLCLFWKCFNLLDVKKKSAKTRILPIQSEYSINMEFLNFMIFLVIILRVNVLTL